MSVFLPYFRVRTIFDASTEALLPRPIPPLSGYFDVLMEYARQARWGKQPATCWERATATTATIAKVV